MTVAVESRHGSILKAKLAERRQELLEALATGLGPDTYQRMVGQLQGLADAMKLSEDADQELYGGSPDAGAQRQED